MLPIAAKEAVEYVTQNLKRLDFIIVSTDPGCFSRVHSLRKKPDIVSDDWGNLVLTVFSGKHSAQITFRNNYKYYRDVALPSGTAIMVQSPEGFRTIANILFKPA